MLRKTNQQLPLHANMALNVERITIAHGNLPNQSRVCVSKVGNSIIHTRLSADWVKQHVIRHYRFDNDIHCCFYLSGLHDHYLIKHKQNRYLLRLYRSAWRDRQHIGFELEWLAHLKKHHCSVAAPVLNQTQSLFNQYRLHKKTQHSALFHYVPGSPPPKGLDDTLSTALGHAVANVHLQSLNFSTHYHRPVLNIEFLLQRSIRFINPYLNDHQLEILHSEQTHIADNLQHLNCRAPYFVPCIGDVNLGNMHVVENKHIILNHFDQCGIGWRAFEIAKFYTSIAHLPRAQQMINAFMNGYQQMSPLCDDEIHALSYFAKTALIWEMAINAENADYMGHQPLLKASFWDTRLTNLQNMRWPV